jgi:ribosome-associated heat shock protein Hsp15
MAKNKQTTVVDEAGIRLDKWLWAARFYKTRSIARDMVQGGKVHYNEQRCKASKQVEIGGRVKVTQGDEEKVVLIERISGQRRGACEAQTLYSETEQSIQKREENAIARKNNTFFSPRPDSKPDKKQRRKIIQFKNINNTQEN